MKIRKFFLFIFFITQVYLLFFISVSTSKQGKKIECVTSSLFVKCYFYECLDGIATIKDGQRVIQKTVLENNNTIEFIPLSSYINVSLICKVPIYTQDISYEIRKTWFSYIPSEKELSQIIVRKGCYLIRSKIKNNIPFIEINFYSDEGCFENNKKDTYEIKLKEYYPVYSGCFCIEKNEGLLVSRSEKLMEFRVIKLSEEGEILIPLRKGWNLISNPSDKEITIEDLKSYGCRVSKILTYNTSNKSWMKTDKIMPSSIGYAMRITNDECIVTLKINRKKEDFVLNLKKGWNLIAGIDGLTCDDLAKYGCIPRKKYGKCFYSYVNGRWKMESVMEFGRGYFVMCN